MTGGALSGLKILERSEFIAGPYCGKLFADLGAEVIKIEKPGPGDKARSWGPFPGDIPHPEKSGLFLFLNTNRLGVTLNLEMAAGLKIFREMAKRVDVIVEDCRPREAKRLGLEYESLHEINPRLVLSSISPFGQFGPYRDHKTCNLVNLAVSGEAYINPMTGVADIEQEPPLKLPLHVGDFRAGLIAAICTMLAVTARQVTGSGQHVDVSQQDAVALQVWRELVQYTYEGFLFTRQKSGKGIVGGMFACKDGHVFVDVMADIFWMGLMSMMGNPDWAREDWCKDRASRHENGDGLNLLVADWMSQHTAEEIERAAAAERVPCSAVSSVDRLINSEQLAARDFFVDINRAEVGRIKYPGAPYKLSSTPWQVRRPAPLLGEHNEQVYCGTLGYSRQDLVKLRQAGVI